MGAWSSTARHRPAITHSTTEKELGLHESKTTTSWTYCLPPIRIRLKPEMKFRSGKTPACRERVRELSLDSCARVNTDLPSSRGNPMEKDQEGNLESSVLRCQNPPIHLGGPGVGEEEGRVNARAEGKMTAGGPPHSEHHGNPCHSGADPRRPQSWEDSVGPSRSTRCPSSCPSTFSTPKCGIQSLP